MQKYIGHCGISMINNTSFYFANYFDWIIMKDVIIKKTDTPRHIYIKLDFLQTYINEISTIILYYLILSYLTMLD